VNFVNTSTNSSNDYWEFGDGGTSTSNSPSYNYNATGTFLAKLISTSATGCNDTITKSILVTNRMAIGIQTYNNSDPLLVHTLSDNEYLIEQKLDSEMNLNFILKDVTGRTVIDYGTLRADKINLPVNLKDKSQGVYFLTITANDKPVTIKLPVK
jgi:PKD repeat protein